MVSDTDIDSAIDTLDTIKRKLDAYDFEQVLEVIDVLERCKETMDDNTD